MADKSENLIKKTCKELGLTYRELGEAIGYGEETISKASRAEKISMPMQRAVELFLQNRELESKLSHLNELKTILKKIME